MFGKNHVWWFGIAWPVIVIALGGLAAYEYAHNKQVSAPITPPPTQSSAHKQVPVPTPPIAPVPEVSKYPHQATILPHAQTYYIRDGKIIECYGEGHHPKQYIECMLLGEVKAEGRLFYMARIAPNQNFWEVDYLFETKDILRLP